MISAWLVAAAVLAAGPSEYPTDPEEQDKLCEVIGEAPNLSVPPRDRLWFKETCTCTSEAGCGRATSSRYSERLAAAERARKAAAAAKAAAAKARAERFAAGRSATASLRRAFWECANGGPGDCLVAGEKLEKACRAHGLRFSTIDYTNPRDECYGQF